MENESHSEVTKNSCLNCGNEYEGNFCPLCGQSTKTERFSMKYIFSNLFSAILGNDGIIWLSYKNLIIRPGSMVMDIIEGRRKRYMTPFPMLLLSLTIYLVVAQITGELNEEKSTNLVKELELSVNDDRSQDFAAESPNYSDSSIELRKKINSCYIFFWDHYTLFFLLTLPLFLVAARLCYGKKNRKRYYWGEYCIPIVYAMVLVVLFQIITSLTYPISHDIVTIMKRISVPVTAMAIVVCFKKMMGLGVVKSIWCGFLTTAVYYFILFVVVLIVCIIATIFIILSII